MNILVEDLPNVIEINDNSYQIDPDFRTCLQIILAFEDDALTPQEKQIILLSMLFITLPTDTKQAIEKGQLFLNGGKVYEADNNPLRLYSFSKDANLIFAAFRATHGIDLSTADLHWWQFLALFMDLGQDTTFCQLVGFRKRLKTGKTTKEERVAASEMGDLIDLPELDERTLEEKEMLLEFDRRVKEAEMRRNNGNR